MITRTCRVSGKKFTITADDLDFYRKMEIISAEDYEKLKSSSFAKASDDERAEIVKNCVGLPTLCPEERQRRRLAWRNERKLYARKCDLCEKNIISIYDKNAEFPVYCQDCWWSDKWDAKNFSRDFDFSRPFFEQINELYLEIPHRGLFITGRNENSEFTNCAGSNRNCYLLLGNSAQSEDCLYGNGVTDSRDCVDVLFGQQNELCYEIINCNKSFELLFSQNCSGCSSSWFLKNCIGCSNCFGCVNLRNKQYYFLNKKYSKEEYQEKIKEVFAKNSISELFKSFKKFCLKFPHKYAEIVRSENCSGDFIFNSKNCQNCFETAHSEDCKWVISTKKCHTSYDFYGFGYNSELVYESVGSGEGFSIVSCFACDRSSNIEYSIECSGSHDLFGCVGLKHAQYCILNKQYTKDEYFKLREKIIEHMKQPHPNPLLGGEGASCEWGEFFPIELSPFAYNETVAQEYFPLNPLKSGLKPDENGFYKSPDLGGFKFKWKDKISRDFRPATIAEIPDDIKDVDDSICREILACENLISSPLTRGAEGGCSVQRCGRNYQIQKPELRFYRKMNLPIPRKCPDCRHADRMKLRNPRTLFERSCSDCEKDIQTTFAPDRPEKVLCEECYLKIVN